MVPFIHLSSGFCSGSFPLKFKYLGLARHCSIINAASVSNTAVLVFFSGSFNFVQDMDQLLCLLLADDFELLDFLMLFYILNALMISV